MEKIRWAVLGAGGIARRRTIPEGIVPASNAELAVVFSPHSGADVARTFGATAADSEDALYSHDWEALYVASPVDCHARQVVRAARAGRHVLCEKPLAINSAEAKRMVDVCSENGVKLGVGLMMRYHALHRQAAQLVRDNAIGTAVYGRAQLSCWYPPIEDAWRQDPLRSGGGVIPDLATHCIDLLEMVLGQKVSTVSCLTANAVHNYPVEDTAVVMLNFDGGAIGTVDCLFNTPDMAVENRLEVYGSAGSLLAQGTIGQSSGGELRYCSSSQSAGYDASQQSKEATAWTMVDTEPVNLYRAEIEDFGRAILKDGSPAADGEQGLWIQRVQEACYDSAATGEKVFLPCC